MTFSWTGAFACLATEHDTEVYIKSSFAEPLDEGKKTGGGKTLDGGSVLNNRRHWIMIWVRLGGPYPDMSTRTRD